MDSHYHETQPYSTRRERCSPHFCSWSWDAPVPPHLWGGCEQGCNMPHGKAWDEEGESRATCNTSLHSLWGGKQQAAAPEEMQPLPQHWWDAELAHAFLQGELREKGKGWIPPGLTFFHLPHSNLLITSTSRHIPRAHLHPISVSVPEPVPRDSPGVLHFTELHNASTKRRRPFNWQRSRVLWFRGFFY